MISSVSRSLPLVYSRAIHFSAIQNSVFMKRQKKMDPEVAKQRENRRRKKLEREIRNMQKHSKKEKPIDEMSLDVKSSKNIQERVRVVAPYTVEEEDHFALSFKDYTRSRNLLQKADDLWVMNAIAQQKKALLELRQLDGRLYEMAIQPDSHLPLSSAGPSLTKPNRLYQPPDGEYYDTTRTFT